MRLARELLLLRRVRELDAEDGAQEPEFYGQPGRRVRPLLFLWSQRGQTRARAKYTPGGDVVAGSLEHGKPVLLEQGSKKRGYTREKGGVWLVGQDHERALQGVKACSVNDKQCIWPGI